MANDDQQVVSTDDPFSVEDYKRLVNDAPACNLTNQIYCMISVGHLYNTYAYKGVKDLLKKEFPIIFKLIYELPLEDIPLFIAVPDKVIVSVAKWRLSIGV